MHPNNNNNQQQQQMNNFRNNYNAWCNTNNNSNSNMPVQQQQQQQLQQRVVNWIAEDINKYQQQLQQHPHLNNNNNNNRNINNNNNNNNNNNMNYNQHLLQGQQQQPQQQQQQQQRYLQQYNNYQTQLSSDIDFYYTQTQQQHHQQQHVHLQQQQHQQIQPNTQHQQQVHALPTAYGGAVSAATTTTTATVNLPQSPQQQQQQQQQIHHSQLHSPQQQQQPPQQQSPHQPLQAHAHARAALLLQQQQQHRRLVSIDGMQSGVPTLTTPTLTPTTLRSIEESFELLTNEPCNVPFQAGFKPPPLAPLPNVAAVNTNNPTLATAALSAYCGAGGTNAVSNAASLIDTDSEDSQSSYNAGQYNDDNTTTDTSSAATDSTSYQNGMNNVLGSGVTLTTSNGVTNDFTSVLASLSKNAPMFSSNAASSSTSPGNSNMNTSNSATTAAATPAAPTRRGGGRRPTKATNMSPEEEEKRRIRRERNKLAAARCRKRRVDQTNELLHEVDLLEKKREELKKDIEKLSTAKVQLEYVIETHRSSCQKVRDDILSVSTYNGLIAPVVSNSNSNDSSSATITGLDPTLTSTGRSNSPLDLKPILIEDHLLQIKDEPLDNALDSNSSLDHDGPPSPKRILVSSNNHMRLPDMSTLTASLTTPTGPAVADSLNTPIMPLPPVSFGGFSISSSNPIVTSAAGGVVVSNNSINPMIMSNNPVLNALNKTNKQRPNSLPTVPRSFTQGLQLHTSSDGKPLTEIQGVPIQTPSTGNFNYESLMLGGTGLTPVAGPLQPTCSSQNKNPLELPTPTSEPSKLVSL